MPVPVPTTVLMNSHNNSCPWCVIIAAIMKSISCASHTSHNTQKLIPIGSESRLAQIVFHVVELMQIAKFCVFTFFYSN